MNYFFDGLLKHNHNLIAFDYTFNRMVKLHIPLFSDKKLLILNSTCKCKSIVIFIIS